MKHYTHKLTALLLAALIMVSPVAQLARAEEAVYHTETKYPLLADVRDQLDEDEIVTAYDVVIDMGDYFNPADVSGFKVENTNQSTDKVDVSFFSAHATDGTAFSSDMPGSYFAYYVAKPVSGHPAYEISRRITVNAVEEPAVPVVPETVEAFQEDESADEDSEDDPYEESEINDSEEAAFEDEGEPEEEYDDAEEFPQEGDVSEETDSEGTLSDWEEESDEDDDADLGDDEYAGEYDDDECSDEDLTSGDWDEADDDFDVEDYDGTDPDEEYYDDPKEDDFDDEDEKEFIDESDVEDESVDDPAGEGDASDDEDEDGEEAETTPEPSDDPTFDMPQIYDEPIETIAPVDSPEPTEVIVEETSVGIPEDDEDVPGDDGDDAVGDDSDEELDGDDAASDDGDDGETTEGTDEEPSPEEAVEPSEAFTLPVDQILTTVLEPTLSLASVDGGEGDDDATEEEDDMEEIDPDNIVLEGDAKMVRGKKVSYPSSLGSWSTFKYTVNGKMAYCLESSKTSPKGGSFAQEILDSNPNLTKALYYGYGGPEDLSASFFPDYSANVRYILTHIAASYFFTGSYSSATKGCSSSGLKKYRVQEWIDYIAGLEDPPSPGISLSDKSLEVTGIANGVQTTSSTTLNADHRNSITLALPDNVTFHNENTGETQTGGTVTIGGGTTFHFSAPTSVSGTWKTGDMKGMIAMIWKVLVVKTGTKTQKLGSYASEEYGGSVHFTVTWKSEVTLNIVKADAANTDVHLAGAVIGVYSDADCTNQLTTMTTGADGSASCTIPREYARLYLKELQAPTGYRLSKTVFTVDMPDGDSVTALIKNDQQRAGLKITKRGEVLTGADVTDAGVRFIYETRKLSGAVYRVTAESAIYTPDGALMYQKGDVVADALTTNDSGEVMLNNVPLGSYVVEETQAPAGFVLSGEKHTVKLEYAGQDAEVAFNETTFTNERQKAAVTIHKQDGETKNPLAGGTFALYAGSAIVSYKGDNLVAAGTLIETVVTGADGSAAFAADLPVGFCYEIREVAPPAGYTFGVEKYEFSFSAAAQTQAVSEFGYTFSNDRITATLSLHKKDAETGNEQGDAQLAGAVYALYAREAVVHPDGKTGTLYEKDALVTTMTTDAVGDAKAENLPLGKYYLKEITPSAGYLLDANEYDVDCTKYDPGKYLILVEATVKEQVIKQPFQVIKAANNGKTDADLIKGAGFTAWLVSDLMKNADGSYNFSNAEPVALGANGETESFTDEKGHATSVPLPFGTYIVRETTTPKNYAPVDDFIVTIKENNPTKPQVWRVLLDEEFAAKLKIYKADSATGRTILLPGAEFSIYDVDNDTFVEQVTTYPQTVKHTTFTTDESGTLTLPETLRPGHYRITEINAPFGYTLNRAEADVTISDEALHQVDAVSGDLVIEVTMHDAPARGRVTVYKEGETLSHYEDGQFIYEVQRLPGATFEVIAAEDIYTADNQRDANGNRYLEYAAGTVVAMLTTDENGEARTEDLPLGTYKVIEKKAPVGYVLKAEPVTVTLAYADQETEIVVEAATVADARQKVSLVVEKKAKDKDIRLPGATLGLYAGEDIRAHDTVIVPAGTCIATAVSDETGSVAFDIDLPLGKYLVNELQAPVGYVLSDEVVELEAAYQGQDVKVVSVTGIYENQSTRMVISKADATTGVELDGAKLTLLDASGKEMDSWTSVAGEPHLIEGLAIGATYTLREDIAPYGYLISNTVKFTVGDTADIQKVVMKDEVPTGKIIINKSGEFLSDVSVLDSATGWIGNTFSFITGGLKDVTFGVYAFDDIKQADGVSPDYYAAGTQIGTITTDSTGVATMENLPLGRYMVKEIATQDGYVLDDQARLIDLTYRDSKTPVVTYSEAWQNERQRARVTVVKKQKDGDRLLEGAVFGLYSAEDITGENGKVILAKDTLIEQRATDSNGKLTFEVDLPVGFDYTIREITPPAGYASDPNAQSFTFDGSNTDVAVVEMEYAFKDIPTLVDVTKSSLTTGEELEGASLQVTDEDGNVIDSWVSGTEPHRITGLVVDKTYTLTETLPASGYVTAESIEFTISDIGEVQPVEMKDDVTKVKISKTDLTGKKELEGATLTILESEGKVVETWTSTTEPHYIEMLPIGKYTLREETAPSGYLVAEDVEFEVKDTGEIQTVTMKDAQENPEQPGTPMPDTPKTGDMNNPLLWGGIGVVALLGLMTAVLVMRKNRRKF